MLCSVQVTLSVDDAEPGLAKFALNVTFEGTAGGVEESGFPEQLSWSGGWFAPKPPGYTKLHSL